MPEATAHPRGSLYAALCWSETLGNAKHVDGCAVVTERLMCITGWQRWMEERIRWTTSVPCASGATAVKRSTNAGHGERKQSPKAQRRTTQNAYKTSVKRTQCAANAINENTGERTRHAETPMKQAINERKKSDVPDSLRKSQIKNAL